MNNRLIFLPIELEIPTTGFLLNQRCQPTFKGMWNTKILTENDIEQSTIKKITQQLPFEKITLAKYNTQMSDIVSHIDVQYDYVKSHLEFEHILQNEPAGYRVLLEGKTDSLQVFVRNEWKIARLPSCPFAYLINSTAANHKVLNDQGRKSMYFRGFLNKKNHEKLIRENLQKFLEYAIYSE